MAVSLTISKTLGGAAVADTLAGDPGNSGVDLGSVINSEYTPIIDKSANTGWQALYIRHNATVDEITDCGSFIEEFSQVYGGAAASAAADYATMKSKGNSSSDSANNGDGNGAGLRIEHDKDLGGTLGASAFDGSRAQVSIYGKDPGGGQEGISLATAFEVHQDAMVRDNAGSPVAPSAPVAGKIGIAGDATLGDNAYVKLRFYLEDAAPDGGIIQWDWVFKYSFTA